MGDATLTLRISGLTRADWDALAASFKNHFLSLPGAVGGTDANGAQTFTFNSKTVGQTVTLTVVQAVYGEAGKTLG